MVFFSTEGWKDSARNVEENGEFVCNLVSRDLAEAMNETAAPLPPGENEMVRAGLDAAPSRMVKPPRVARAIAALECRKTAILRLAGADGVELDTWLVLGEVVGVHIDDSVIVNGLVDVTRITHHTEGILGDIIDIVSIDGRTMRVQIAPLNGGDAYVNVLEEAWQKYDPDARVIRNYCPVLEFGLIGESMHKVDEKSAIADLKMLARVSTIQQQLLQSWDVLATITPYDYSAFRNTLGKSSGFQ